MLEPFQLPFVQHGIVEVLILAVAGGLIGTWIVLRGLAFYAHAVGTAAFPGLVLADGPRLRRRPRRRRDRGAGRHRRRAARAPRGGARPLRLAHRARPRRRAGGRRDPRQRRLPLRPAASRRCSSAACCSSTAATTPSPPPARRCVARRRARARAALAGDRLRPGLGARARRPLGGCPTSCCSRSWRSSPSPRSRRSARCWPRRCSSSRRRRRACVCSRLRPWQLATVALVARRGRRRAVAVGQVNAPPGPAIAVLAGGVFAAVAVGRALGRRAARRAAAAAAARRSRCSPPAAAPSAAARRPARSRSSPRRPRSATSPAPSAATAAKVVQLLQPNTDPARLRAAPVGRPRDGRRRRRPRSTATTSTAGWATSSRRPAATPTSSTSARASRSSVAGESEGPEASRYDPHWWHDPRNAQAAVARSATR